MRLTRLLLPGLALGAAAVLLTPAQSTAYILLGWNLPLTLRHARVFDNFTGTNANNNTTPHPNWPGYTGCEMAIWKAMAEWGSGLHGDGTGDPHQNGGLGSGGANFDVTWQGNATSIGSIGNNTHSMITGSQGGVLAYCESFGQNSGWRIRYYQSWDWDDGPGTSISGTDLQGVACHEYGHALGLDHTTVSGSTMTAFISGNGVGARSIESDDIAGVQAIYGVKSASKPTITGLGIGTPLTIHGSNFSASSNEVWFTQAGTGGTGQPIKVTGLTSNGTSLSVTVPASAGPGDVLVKNGAGGGHANLSNAYPFDPAAVCTPVVYCTAKVNSLGLVPQIGWTGEPKLTTGNFALTCFNGGLGGQPGVFFWSDNGASSQPFQGGFLCTQPPVLRSAVHFYDVFGFVAVPVSVGVLDVGITRRFQFWFRDPDHPDMTSVGLSDALEVVFCN
jgi:hypothetical protein